MSLFPSGDLSQVLKGRRLRVHLALHDTPFKTETTPGVSNLIISLLHIVKKEP